MTCTKGHDYEKFDAYRIFCRRCGTFQSAPAYQPSWVYYPPTFVPYVPTYTPFWYGASTSIEPNTYVFDSTLDDNIAYTLNEGGIS